MTQIIDTNVLRAANGDALQAGSGCVRATVAALQAVQRGGRIALDAGWEILGEYRRNAREGGQPGVGDVFLKWLLTNHFNPSRCDRIPIASHPERGYEEFPGDPDLANFDRSDRKFVAVALAHPEHPRSSTPPTPTGATITAPSPGMASKLSTCART